MPPVGSCGVSVTSNDTIGQSRDTVGGGFDTIKVSRATHIGFLFRARVVQKDVFCPMYCFEDTAAVGYASLSDGPFAFRLDNGINEPVVAMLEVNGKLYTSEYRIQPNGGRVIREVHERNIATTQLLIYRFPIVFDNVLDREVGPSEVRLQSINDIDEFTSVCRVIFLPVRGGVAATRSGQWIVEPNAEPLGIVVVRLGHRTTLSQFFGVESPQSSQMEVPQHLSETRRNGLRKSSCNPGRGNFSSTMRRIPPSSAPSTPRSGNKPFHNGTQKYPGCCMRKNSNSLNSTVKASRRESEGRTPIRLASRSSSVQSSSQRKHVSRFVNPCGTPDPILPINKYRHLKSSTSCVREPLAMSFSSVRSRSENESNFNSVNAVRKHPTALVQVPSIHPKITSPYVPQHTRSTSPQEITENLHLHTDGSPLPLPLSHNRRISVGSNAVCSANNGVVIVSSAGEGCSNRSVSPILRRSRGHKNKNGSSAGRGHAAANNNNDLSAISHSSSNSTTARSSTHHSHSKKICSRCNVLFDRERRMYEEVIDALQRQGSVQGREFAQLRMRNDSLLKLLDAVRNSREGQPRHSVNFAEFQNISAAVPMDALEGTLTPRRTGLIPTPRIFHPDNEKESESESVTDTPHKSVTRKSKDAELSGSDSDSSDAGRDSSTISSAESESEEESENQSSARPTVPPIRNGPW